MSIWLWLRQPVCQHPRDEFVEVVTGVTLGYDMRPTRQFSFGRVCQDCGRETWSHGMVLPSDRRMHPKAYNENGWPVDGQGRELEIAI